jgi:hypothetical protein
LCIGWGVMEAPLKKHEGTDLGWAGPNRKLDQMRTGQNQVE